MIKFRINLKLYMYIIFSMEIYKFYDNYFKLNYSLTTKISISISISLYYVVFTYYSLLLKSYS